MTPAVPGCFSAVRCTARGGVFITALIAFMVIYLLTGCGGSRPRAPVEERGGPAQHYARIYVVQKGDTMYSIAFRYGLDYRRLAAANELRTPYTIYPGQRLYLRESGSLPPPVVAARRPPQTAPAARTPRSQAPASGASSNANVNGPSSSVRDNSATGAEPGWRWPSSGRVIRGYSPTVHKGIDIDGKSGDPVYAVAAGKVVYAGTGIVGFGELLIVKHSDLYLSAYGHNSRLLVAEGSSVRAGEKIALKGNTGTDKVKLHFEIRRGGKPVDPQQLLPRR